MDKKDRLNVAADVMQVKEELDRLRAENQHLQKDRNVMSLQLVEVRAENQRLRKMWNLCDELDTELDGVSVPASAAAILNAIRDLLDASERRRGEGWV